jgi:hypothetical protein
MSSKRLDQGPRSIGELAAKIVAGLRRQRARRINGRTLPTLNHKELSQ